MKFKNLQQLCFTVHAADIIIGLSEEKHIIYKVTPQVGKIEELSRSLEKENMPFTCVTSLHIYSPYLPHTIQTGSPGSGKRCSLLLLT